MMVLRADNESVLFGGRIGSVVVAAAAARRPPPAARRAPATRQACVRRNILSYRCSRVVSETFSDLESGD